MRAGYQEAIEIAPPGGSAEMTQLDEGAVAAPAEDACFEERVAVRAVDPVFSDLDGSVAGALPGLPELTLDLGGGA